MRIATFLPHVGVFGGVRRFLELGNAWRALGNEVTLYHPGGEPPDWLPYRGRVAPLADAGREASDVALCGEAGTYAAFRAHDASRHVYYCVLEKDPGLARAIADRGCLLAANSGPLRRAVSRRARRPVLDGIGGINLEQFRVRRDARPESPLRILVNGRRSRPKKGTDLILRALRGLGADVAPFEVVLFDTLPRGEDSDPRVQAPAPENARWVLGPSQAELVALYQSAHVFVAAERKAGWCNTALEAMACGCAVACTRSGTTDYAEHEVNALVVPVRHPIWIRRAVRRLLVEAPLRGRLAGAAPQAALPWTWDRLARRLLEQLEPP